MRFPVKTIISLLFLDPHSVHKIRHSFALFLSLFFLLPYLFKTTACADFQNIRSNRVTFQSSYIQYPNSHFEEDDLGAGTGDGGGGDPGGPGQEAPGPEEPGGDDPGSDMIGFDDEGQDEAEPEDPSPTDDASGDTIPEDPEPSFDLGDGEGGEDLDEVASERPSPESDGPVYSSDIDGSVAYLPPFYQDEVSPDAFVPAPQSKDEALESGPSSTSITLAYILFYLSIGAVICFIVVVTAPLRARRRSNLQRSTPSFHSSAPYRPSLINRSKRLSNRIGMIPIQRVYSELQQIDYMEGHAFEYWCAELLRDNGFTKISVTPGSGDYGVDILATLNGITFAVQCKRYDSNVGISAVQQVFSGRQYYKRDKGAIMTNQGLTPSAIALARSTGTYVWDRAVIEDMLKIRYGIRKR